jgi:general secretion pathway protein M
VTKLNRKQLIAIGAAVLLLASSVLVLALCLGARSDAAQELAETQDTLANLQARAERKPRVSTRALDGTAPTSAFLDAPTVGLAGAQLEAYLAQLAGEQQVRIASSGIQSPRREDPTDTIRVEANFDVTLKVLQTILYKLEAEEPYVFVESITIKPSGTPAQRNAEDPLLRVYLNLHALWHRKTA